MKLSRAWLEAQQSAARDDAQPRPGFRWLPQAGLLPPVAKPTLLSQLLLLSLGAGELCELLFERYFGEAFFQLGGIEVLAQAREWSKAAAELLAGHGGIACAWRGDCLARERA